MKTHVNSYGRQTVHRSKVDPGVSELGPVHMILGQLIAPGQLTDPGVNFGSVHGLAPVTVHMSLLFPQGNFKRQVTRCATPGNPPCQGNFSPCEQNAEVAPARVVLCMLIINVWNKFFNEKYQKAPEISICV